MFKITELKHFLNVAEGTAKTAFSAIKKDLAVIKKVERDSGRDVKIVADKKLESLIVKSLREETPFPILSEESGLISADREKGTDGHKWIVDPLDGSLNFARDIPFYVISIALWQGMEPVLGLVYDFNNNESFTGLVNKGAWLNGKAIKVSEIKEKAKGVLCTGFPVSTNFSKKRLLDFVKDAMAFKKVRLFGSAALSLAYVSCGRCDMYQENDIKIWDVAAGLALIKAAGGAIKILPSTKENTFMVKAANKNLLHED